MVETRGFSEIVTTQTPSAPGGDYPNYFLLKIHYDYHLITFGISEVGWVLMTRIPNDDCNNYLLSDLRIKPFEESFVLHENKGHEICFRTVHVLWVWVNTKLTWRSILGKFKLNQPQIDSSFSVICHIKSIYLLHGRLIWLTLG